jgi:hypothetical protein
MASIQTTVITTTLTQEGIAAMQLGALMGIPLSVTKIELSENKVPSGSPEIWLPAGQTNEAYYIQTSNVTTISYNRTALIFDITLNATVPTTAQYNGTTVINGWVNEPTEHGLNSINIGSYAVFVTNPVTHAVIPFLIAYVSPSNIEKYSNSTGGIAGNIIDLLTNFTYTLRTPPQINYVYTTKYKAQVAYIEELTQLSAPSVGLEVDAGLESGGFLLLEDTGHILFQTEPVNSSNIPNDYVVADIKAIAFTDSNYLIWRFTNYISLSDTITIDAIAGNLLVSAEMFSLLPTPLQNAGVLTNNVLVGEIYDRLGLMKKCFIFINSMGNNFIANTALPPLALGDKLICFISNSYGI